MPWGDDGEDYAGQRQAIQGLKNAASKYSYIILEHFGNGIATLVVRISEVNNCRISNRGRVEEWKSIAIRSRLFFINQSPSRLVSLSAETVRSREECLARMKE